MKFSFLFGLAIILILGATQSCKKISKYSDPDLISPSSWDPQFAAPIAFAEFDVYDILARTDSNDVVVIDPTSGQIALVYKGEVTSINAEDIINLPNISDQVILSTTDLGITTVPTFSGTVSAQHTEVNMFNTPNNEEFNTVFFKAGSIDLSFTSNFKHDINLMVTFPYLLKDGTPLSTTMSGTYTGGPVTASASLDLTDVAGNFTNAGSSVNTIVMETSAIINGTGQEVVGNESITVDVDLTDPAYRNATGYFGQQSLGNYADSILIKIFNTSTDGYFELTDPKVKLEMINSFGFPVDIALSNLQSINLNTGVVLPLTGYPNPISILSPTVLGQEETTVFELNTSNTTNISTIISPAPKYFSFEVGGTANPNGPGTNLNFIQDTSRFRINAELELPLVGFAYGFEVVDTVEFNFNEDASQIESVAFRIIVNNGFPVDVTSEIVFVDANYQPLFELTDGFELVVASGVTDENGIVVSKTEKITDLTVEKANISKLSNAKHIIMKADMESRNGLSDNEVVKILDTYEIGLKLGMNIKLNINL